MKDKTVSWKECHKVSAVLLGEEWELAAECFYS